MHVRGIGLQLGGDRALHLDGLRDGPDLKLSVDAHYVVRQDVDAGGLETLETLLGDSRLVIACRHGGDRINAAVIRRNRARIVRLRIGDHHIRVRNRCAGVICNRADDRTIQCLRLRLMRHEHEQADEESTRPDQ